MEQIVIQVTVSLGWRWCRSGGDARRWCSDVQTLCPEPFILVLVSTAPLPLPPAVPTTPPICSTGQFAPDAESDTVDVDKIPAEWMGLDVGPKTISSFSAALAPCKTVVSIFFCTTYCTAAVTKQIIPSDEILPGGIEPTCC